MKYKSDFFPCFLHTLSFTLLLFPPISNLRAGDVFGFHQAKTGKESINAEADV